MHQVPVLNFLDFIAADGDALTTTSLKVAAVFGKRHTHVLRAIEKLRKQLPEDRQPNFGLTLMDVQGPNGSTRQEPAFVITRDGFTLLAMGFIGKKALIFKLAYIDAFNAMAAYVKNQREGLGYRRAKHELECKDSERRGSYHGRGLNERKQEIPILKTEQALLMVLSQPSLIPN